MSIMSSAGDDPFCLISKLDRPFYGSDKGQAQNYSQEMSAHSTAAIAVDPLLPGLGLMRSDQDVQLGKLPVKVEHSNSPSLSNHRLHHQQQNVSFNVHHSHPLNSNIDNPTPQQSFPPNYAHLTSWTSRFTAQGSSPFSPISAEALQVPMMCDQLSHLPRTAGSHLTSRMYKTSPYHNAFSHMSPLQPSPGNKLKTVSGSHPDATAAVLPMNSSGELVLKSLPSRENRFKRTAEALQKSGLWEVAMKTGNLIKRNQELQNELEQFKMDALNFLKSVIKNPENRDFIKTVLNNTLSARSSEGKRSSVMTVVVSAAAAAAAAAIKYESSSAKSDLSSMDSSNSVSAISSGELRNASCVSVIDKPVSTNVISSDMSCLVSNSNLCNQTSVT